MLAVCFLVRRVLDNNYEQLILNGANRIYSNRKRLQAENLALLLVLRYEGQAFAGKK